MTPTDKKTQPAGPGLDAPARNHGIDAWRAAAIAAVVCIHTEPFRALGDRNAIYWAAGVLINSLSRFAVPFFFVTSGYFFAKRFCAGRPDAGRYARYLKRLFLVFAAWSAIYLVFPTSLGDLWRYGPVKAAQIHAAAVLGSLTVTEAVFQGTKIHLWFLVALMIALSIVFALHRGRMRWLLYAGAAALYAAGLLAGPYSRTPAGIELGFDTRNGPFFATLFVAIGVWLSGREEKDRRGAAVALAAFGVAMQLAEVLLLRGAYGLSPFDHDYLIGTAPLGAGVMLLALSNGAGAARGTRLSEAGRYALGIYVIHFLFIELSNPLSYLIRGPLWEVVFPAVVFTLSYISVRLLSRVPYLKKIVA